MKATEIKINKKVNCIYKKHRICLGSRKACEMWRCVFEGKGVDFENEAGRFRVGDRDTRPESECRLDREILREVLCMVKPHKGGLRLMK